MQSGNDKDEEKDHDMVVEYHPTGRRTPRNIFARTEYV